MTATTGGGDAVTGVLAAERGATTIADRVVAKIAAHAAREALDEVPEDQRGTGTGEAGRPPHATVLVHRDTARVRISLELRYPSDIGAQCGAVRRQVVRRVRTLAGMEVPEVAVQVERLHSAYTRDKGRGRVR
ncbi:Asp23/Gls24 family envelope stress response protein [Streptomyces sp. NPDC049837]|uniref:Asp23/Gls24 family envelope stress response protein n=1 Tax=Streptomyces sp. NPDC049837 TaxID=3155277 RepID=UPI0034121EE3